MFNRKKSRFYTWLLLSFLVSLWSTGYVNAATFAERLSDVGLDINSFSNKNSISRYEVARLLNAANCEDCVQAPEWMKQTYTQNFWDNFRAIDWKDFSDVDYQWWVWNKKIYYYCVAYVWENGYMAWYPSTSSKCKWKFCGQENITTSEFYQTVLNIIQPQIREKYRINWWDVKSWMKWLKKNSMQMRVLNQTNIDAIDKADSKSQYAQSNDEFQAWLKYCMYNLSACNFQSFGPIGTWYWPVSELNILYKEWIITADDALKVASFPNMGWDEAIRIFSAVYDNYASCSFNTDYDCDWLVNGKDNCPYMYNANQYDLDGDGIWNVCDDDIDGDGNKNSIWIVDDNNRIVISLWGSNLDQTPLGNGDLWFSFFINVDAISTWFPTLVRFSPLTNWDISSIEWNFWDGTTRTVNSSNKVSHTFEKSGIFTVKAVATAKNGSQSFAINKVFIGNPSSENYMLNISPSVLFKNWNIEYTFSAQHSGNLDTIKWSVNDWSEESLKITDKFKMTINEDGLYLVNAKWYANWELKAIAALSIIKDWNQSFAGMNLKVWDLWDKTYVVANLVGVDRNDIDYIGVDRWWETIISSDLIQTHSYAEAWLKTIQQNIHLTNWMTLRSMATITIQNPLLKQSCAVNIEWNRLSFNQNENLSLWVSLYPKSSVLSLFTSYQAWHKSFTYNPNLSKTVLDFAYLTAWDKLLTNSVEVNKCVALTNQWTIHINPIDFCMTAMKNWTLSKYKCDMDGDGIPDICDDDIDGDWVKNLVWIISYENKNCFISADSIDVNIFKRQFGVCSLDNCPFSSNSNQSDLNNDWIGDVCGDSVLNLLNYTYEIDEEESVLALDADSDQDWVPDGLDACVDVPWNSLDGCPEFYSKDCWAYSSCGNGHIDDGETCSNCPQDVGVCCGNGTLDKGEDCKSCPADAGGCDLCGNHKVDKWEDCNNCPWDVWECVAVCGNGMIESIENCNNCPQDVWECTAICWNGTVDKWEDCDNCPEDVKVCIDETRENGVVDRESWEECDDGKDKNGKEVVCTKMNTIYDINNPKCWNGEIDEWEYCRLCAVDLWDKCIKERNIKVKEYKKESVNWIENEKWNEYSRTSFDSWYWKVEWNYMNSVGENFSATVNSVEELQYFLKDIEENQLQDTKSELLEKYDEEYFRTKSLWLMYLVVPNTNSERYEIKGVERKWNQINLVYVDNGVGEGADNGVGNWWEEEQLMIGEILYVELGKWESVNWIENEKIDTCGNGVVDEWEDCDFNDLSQQIGWWSDWCSNRCEQIDGDSWKCNPKYDWKTLSSLLNSSDLCVRWKLRNFSFNATKQTWSRMCINGETGKYMEWLAIKSSGKKVDDEIGDVRVDFADSDTDLLLNCPEWALCSPIYPDGGDEIKYKVDACQDGYLLEDWECKCHKEHINSGVIDGTYKCTCPYSKQDWEPYLCRLEYGLQSECWDGDCRERFYQVDWMWRNYSFYFILDDEWAIAAGIENIDDIWDKREALNGAGEVISVLKNYMSPSNCEKLGEKYFTEAWKEITAIYYDTESCKSGCQCSDINNCPNELRKTCGCLNDDVIHEREDCITCPEKVWECTAYCWNEAVEIWEDCINCSDDVKLCRSQTCWNGVLDEDAGEECDNWAENGDKKYLAWDGLTYIVDGVEKVKCTSMCTKYDSENPWCGDWNFEAWERCDNCSVDLWEKCVDNRNLCGNGNREWWENCDNCPDDAWELCIQSYMPDELNLPESSDVEDEGDSDWHLDNDDCNTCPCEYVEFSTELVRWDTIRAKLWDKQEFVFYRYSGPVAVESFIDLDSGWKSGWEKWSWDWEWSWKSNVDDTKIGTRKAKLIVRRDGEKTVREFIVPSDGVDVSEGENSSVWSKFKNLIWL